MSLIIPANSAAADGGFNVANSCMFNAGDSPYMHKTPSSAGNRRTFTLSYWIKSSVDGYHFTVGSDNFQVRFTSNAFFIGEYSSGSYAFRIQTTRLFRDPSAWLHIVVAVDTTQGTDTNRVKIYINGVQETFFSTSNYPSVNYDTSVNNTVKHQVGVNGGISSYLNAYLAEVCLIDGSALAPTSFGEFDEDSGIWKPIDVSGLTFGTNGFYLDFEDSSNLGNDANGGTDLTEVNLAATDQATDTCTNNFCTLNPLWRSRFHNDGTMSQGNCRGSFTADNANRGYLMTTMGVSAGKWYWEAKVIDKTRMYIGIAKQSLMAVTNPFYDETTYNALAINNSGEFYGRYTGSAIDEFATSVSIADNDILGFALDRDNKELYIHKNGTYINSGDPTSGSSRTGGLIDELTGSRDLYIPDNEFIFPFMHDPSTSGQLDIEYNFGGCPAFAISSGNADGNGFGNFEYAVPSGFFALCTKNLAEYG